MPHQLQMTVTSHSSLLHWFYFPYYGISGGAFHGAHGNDPPATDNVLSFPKISVLACKAPCLSQLCTFQLILCTKSK